MKRRRRENGGLQAGECLPAPPPEEGSRGGGTAEAATPETSEGTRQSSYNLFGGNLRIQAYFLKAAFLQYLGSGLRLTGSRSEPQKIWNLSLTSLVRNRIRPTASLIFSLNHENCLKMLKYF